ncbi:MAG: glycosyltransferase [Nitriliruptorales bacterium]
MTSGSDRDGQVRRIAIISLHTSPLDQPGTGDGGGLNVYVLEVARRLAARGVEVDVFTRATQPGQPPVLQVAERFAVHHIEAGPRTRLPKETLANHLCAFLLALEGHVAEHAPGRLYDVVHTHYWLSGWVGRQLRRRWRTPLVHSFHTLARVKNAALAPGDEPEPVVRLLAEERLVEDADRILVSVCGEARLLHRTYGISGARLAVVAPGVDLDIFHPGQAPNPSDAPPGSGPLLLFVGRLQPLKSPEVAVRALAYVRREVPDARLLVVGGVSGSSAGSCGPDELRALALELGVGDGVAVAAARPQRELADLYRASTVVLVPSRSESFGLVALEAQACATPVVAAEVGGLPAVVGGGGGTLVAGHDPADYAAAILDYLRDSARYTRARTSALQAASRATWDVTVEGLLAVYEDVVRSQASAAGVSA